MWREAGGAQSGLWSCQKLRRENFSLGQDTDPPHWCVQSDPRGKSMGESDVYVLVNIEKG